MKRDVIEKCLSDNKDKIIEINNAKTEVSKTYSDEELFLMWAYLQEALLVSPYLSPFDLTRKEYAYCTYKIFGRASALLFLATTKNKKDKWNKKTTRRIANDIIMTYRRRALKFLRDTMTPPYKSRFFDKYCDQRAFGFLNNEGREKAVKLLGIQKKNIIRYGMVRYLSLRNKRL